MRLAQAHRILIAAFIAFALYFGLLKLRHGERVAAGIAFAVAAGFAVYYVAFRSRPPE